MLKVELPLRLNNDAPRHEEARGSGRLVPPLLTSALDGDKWSASCPGRFTSGKKAKKKTVADLMGK
jgi:hypothetical protein